MSTEFQKRFKNKITAGGCVDKFNVQAPINKNLKISQMYKEATHINNSRTKLTPLSKPRKQTFQQQIKAVHNESPSYQKKHHLSIESPTLKGNASPQLSSIYHKKSFSASYVDGISPFFSQEFKPNNSSPSSKMQSPQYLSSYITRDINYSEIPKSFNKEIGFPRYASCYASRNTTAGSEMASYQAPYAFKEYMQLRPSDYVTLGILNERFDVSRKTETNPKRTKVIKNN